MEKWEHGVVRSWKNSEDGKSRTSFFGPDGQENPVDVPGDSFIRIVRVVSTLGTQRWQLVSVEHFPTGVYMS